MEECILRILLLTAGLAFFGGVTNLWRTHLRLKIL
jgi:hypothetical protein